jgi:hypothetical protein
MTDSILLGTGRGNTSREKYCLRPYTMANAVPALSAQPAMTTFWKEGFKLDKCNEFE